MEVKSVTKLESVLGNPMTYDSVVPVKGLGRASMILFGVVWTYINKDHLDDDEKSDFVRPGSGLNRGVVIFFAYLKMINQG